MQHRVLVPVSVSSLLGINMLGVMQHLLNVNQTAGGLIGSLEGWMARPNKGNKDPSGPGPAHDLNRLEP